MSNLFVLRFQKKLWWSVRSLPLALSFVSSVLRFSWLVNGNYLLSLLLMQSQSLPLQPMLTSLLFLVSSVIVNAQTHALFSLISGTLRLAPEQSNALDGLS